MFDRTRGRLAPPPTAAVTAQPQLNKPAVPQALRAARHSGLFEAVARLDTSGLDQQVRSDLSAWIREQYAGTYGSVPVGFVAVCHLGPPYVDHYLNLVMSIVDHYAATDAMPEPFAAARMLARNSAYAFVEVHEGGVLVPIKHDGTAVI